MRGQRFIRGGGEVDIRGKVRVGRNRGSRFRDGIGIFTDLYQWRTAMESRKAGWMLWEGVKLVWSKTWKGTLDLI
jgi:hypothetical protein